MRYWQNQTTNVNGDGIFLTKTEPTAMWVQTSGTFGGATVGMDVSIEGLAFHPLSGFTGSEQSVIEVSLPVDCLIRFTLSGATATTNISLSISGRGL